MAKIIISFVILASLVFYLNFVTSSLITSIKVQLENGQTFKCVDFYKQPAFRNSALGLQVVANLTKLQNQNSVSGLELGSRGCPIGTVPILERSNNYVAYPEVHQPNSNIPHAKRHCTAQVRTVPNLTKKFLGASAAITLFKPNAPGNQWSSARIRVLSNGDSIEAGWMVNPSEFKDDKAHLYVRFSAKGRGCINLDCPGFVQVSTQYPLGLAPNSYSTSSKQIAWSFSIDKHHDDGNWWLSFTPDKHLIGYWPKNLFVSLYDYANQIEFGGEINNPSAVDPPTQMGNGMKADYDTTISSFIFQATVVNENNARVDPSDTEKFADCGDLYTVRDAGHQDDLGRLIFYGGPAS